MITTETLEARTGEARDRIREATERAASYDAKAAALQAQCLELRREAASCRAQIAALAAYCEAAAAVPGAVQSLADTEARFAAAAAHHSDCETRVLEATQIGRLAADALMRAGGTRAQPAELVDLDSRCSSARAVLEHEEQALESARVSMLQARAPIAAHRERLDEAREEAERTWRVAEDPPVAEMAETARARVMADLAGRLSQTNWRSA